MLYNVSLPFLPYLPFLILLFVAWHGTARKFVQTSVKGKRRAYMICMMTKVVNDAVLDYKRKQCKPGESSA